MRHYKARQLEDSGKWRYTFERGDVVVAVGSCSGHSHDTAEEATSCYRNYVLDNLLVFRDDICGPRERHQCSFPECENLGQGGVTIVSMHMVYPLCEKHRTREGAEAVIPAFTESWQS